VVGGHRPKVLDNINKDHMLADVSAILGSLDIVFGEVNS